MVFDNYTCKQEPTFANVHCLADLSSVRYKTSTWNEIKELIKSNYLIVPSLLNNKSEKYDMEWSVGDEAIFRRTRNCKLERNWKEQPNLIQFSLLDAIRRFTRLWTGSCCCLFFFLILACILQFAQYLFVTFNFLANCNCKELPPHPHPPPRLFEWTAYQEKRKNLFEYLNKE